MGRFLLFLGKLKLNVYKHFFPKEILGIGKKKNPKFQTTQVTIN
jgi:hypothetical protein